MKGIAAATVLVCITSVSWMSRHYNDQQKKPAMVYPVVKGEFEMLDFQQYDSSRGDYSVIEKDSARVEYMTYPGGIRVTVQRPESYFAVIKLFDRKGYLTEKGLYFNSGGFKKGNWYRFQDGQLAGVEDNDKAFTFSFEKLYDWLVKEKISLIPGTVGNGLHTEISKEVDEKGIRWKVRWLKYYTSLPNTIQVITIDGKNGQVLDKKNMAFHPSR